MAERNIIFRINGEEYGIDVQLVTAIEPIMDIVPVPNAPARVLGLMNLRGEVIPVYSLRKRFLLEEYTDPINTKLIVTRYQDKRIAFKVDEVLEITDFEEEAVTNMPLIVKNENTEYVRAVANRQGRLILLLNPATMYEGDEEEQMMEALKQMQGA
ncbi:MAG: purine-binding chemotaxis protein CheW [Lachnospiraceae bacterium]|nr:purine-binding chemotaxis protein CheW [Lachnospiraceae bacterium]